MTKKQGSDVEAEGKANDEVGRAAQALARLEPWDLCNVIVRELDRRRLDRLGNPRDPEGLHHAVTIGVWKLVGAPLTAKYEKLAENVAAAGRGVRMRSSFADASAQLRELSFLLEVDWLAEADGPGKLARTLSKRFKRVVQAEAVKHALAQPGPRKRLEWLARACGVEATENGIKSALRN